MSKSTGLYADECVYSGWWELQVAGWAQPPLHGAARCWGFGPASALFLPDKHTQTRCHGAPRDPLALHSHWPGRGNICVNLMIILIPDDDFFFKVCFEFFCSRAINDVWVMGGKTMKHYWLLDSTKWGCNWTTILIIVTRLVYAQNKIVSDSVSTLTLIIINWS